MSDCIPELARQEIALAWVFALQLGELGLGSGMSLRCAVSASPPPASHSPLCTWGSCSYQGEARWGCTQMVELILVLDEPRYRQVHGERGAVLLPPAVGHVEFCVRAGRLHDCCLHRGTATREPWMVGIAPAHLLQLLSVRFPWSQ